MTFLIKYFTTKKCLQRQGYKNWPKRFQEMFHTFWNKHTISNEFVRENHWNFDFKFLPKVMMVTHCACLAKRLVKVTEYQRLAEVKHLSKHPRQKGTYSHF